MSSFDIQSLLEFKPPRYFCPKCFALSPSIFSLGVRKDGEDKVYFCRVCNVQYFLPTNACTFLDAAKYMEQEGYVLKISNLIQHSQQLAQIARQMKLLKHFPPLRALFEALHHAQKFVHFVTYGISPFLIGALKMTAQRVPVRGIATNVDPQVLPELQDFVDEAPQLNVKAYGRDPDWRGTPHQKLIVVDGLLAFKGSANLTTNGWRKAAQDLDVVEAVTNIEEIMGLHNRYFSPIWAERSGLPDTVLIGGPLPDEDIPF